MVTRNKILAALGVILLGWGLWYAFPTRERQVRRQFKALASWAGKDGDEGALASVQTAREAGRFFADPCEWNAEAYNLSGRVSLEEITRYVFAARTRVEKLTVKFYDLAVEFLADGTAHAKATVRVQGTSKDGDAINETHELKCDLIKQDGRWLLSRITLVQVLKR